MATRRDDYLLRFIEQLRLRVTEAVNLRDPVRLNEALHAAVSAQEKLFGRAPAEFMGLSIEEQLRLLGEGETRQNAFGKRMAYAALLRESALVYRARGMDDYATNAFQIGLHVGLLAAAEYGDLPDETRTAIVELAEEVPVEAMHTPVRELLEQVLGGTGRI